MTATPKKPDVVVVGAGPVGLVAACELVRGTSAGCWRRGSSPRRQHPALVRTRPPGRRACADDDDVLRGGGHFISDFSI